ncbi:MAG: hypothetical protein ACK5HT_05490 [Draconibacterium sp.]
MEKKKLKKLELKKQKIVELTDLEASQVKGEGTITVVTISSKPCVAASIAVTSAIVGWSLNACGGEPEPEQPSVKMTHYGADGGAMCVITDVNVYGSAQHC